MGLFCFQEKVVFTNLGLAYSLKNLTYAMESHKTDIIFQQFNKTIEQWITYLNDYTLEMLCHQPQLESWSLGQLYVHIIDDTRYFVDQMKAALADDIHSEKEMHADARIMFANNAFPDMRLTGPSTDQDIRQPQSKEEVEQGLTAIKAEVSTLYTYFDFSHATGKSAHPGFDFFTAAEWLQFAEMHMRHHFRQKQRIDLLNAISPV